MPNVALLLQTHEILHALARSVDAVADLRLEL